MTTDRLYDDADLAQFYDLDNDWGSDLGFCFDLAKDAQSVLDLGCGTGRLAAAIAAEYGVPVTGVDPAAAMLAIARQRPGGDGVDWIAADARHLRLPRRFDLVLLTGHAFQVFLTRDDRSAVLATIARHLDPTGRFIFDSRNPAAEEWHEWRPATSERHLLHPTLGSVKAWNDMVQNAATGIVTYETHYLIRDSGRTFSASSQIAFPGKAEIEMLMGDAGLVVDRWLGDWQGNDDRPDMPEMIPLGRLR